MIHLKKLFLTNAPLVIISLMFGYSFWYIASYNQVITLHINVPLCFSVKTDDNYIIDAPETVKITIEGKRSDIYTLDDASLAAHIDINRLLPGKHGIIITEQHLFLPKNIALVHCKPANLAITISEIEKH